MNEEQEKAMKEAWERVNEIVGCGDGSCLFKRPTGVHTNGGCRCRDKPFCIRALANLFKACAQ